jgi:hypothetical protein
MTRRTGALALLLPLVAAACSPAVDLKQAVQVTDVSSGWFDAGVVEGKNKLVPSATFRIKKGTPETNIPTLALNMVFTQDGSQEHWEDVFVQRVDFGTDGQTSPITVRSETGYRGDPPQSRADMLNNSQFRDMHVQIFGKQTSGQWIELHRLKIERRLLAK